MAGNLLEACRFVQAFSISLVPSDLRKADALNLVHERTKSRHGDTFGLFVREEKSKERGVIDVQSAAAPFG